MRSVSRDYVGKGCNLDPLADSIEEDFQTRRYETQGSKMEGGWMIQAKREGFLRDLLTAERAFTITATGEPNEFKVSFGIGKWVQNLGVAPLEGIVLWRIVFIEVPSLCGVMKSKENSGSMLRSRWS